MKTIFLLFVCVPLPAWAAAQPMNPKTTLSDTRSIAMGETLTAGKRYHPIDSTKSFQSLHIQTAIDYLQFELWQAELAYSKQKGTYRYELEAGCSAPQTDRFLPQTARIGISAMKANSQHWQTMGALHYEHCFNAKLSTALMENYLVYSPQEYWQIRVLLWHLAWWHEYGFSHLHAFHLSGIYLLNDIALHGEVNHNGKRLMKHCAIEFPFADCLIRLGCRFPSPRPTAGFAWCTKRLALSIALSYDIQLGISVGLEIVYRWNHER